MNYKIIFDEERLKKFIDWLPELDSDELYYICLFARKKYNAIVKADKASLKRVVSKKENIYSKILQMEVPLGAYEIDGVTVPQDALAVYITTNPRNLVKANYAVIREILTKIENGNSNTNPYAIALNELQKSKSKSHFVTFDVDNKDYELIPKLAELIGKDSFEVLETRGGFHFIIKIDSISNNWYQPVTDLLKPDQKGDLLSPIPGCTQGMFIPKFL